MAELLCGSQIAGRFCFIDNEAKKIVRQCKLDREMEGRKCKQMKTKWEDKIEALGQSPNITELQQGLSDCQVLVGSMQVSVADSPPASPVTPLSPGAVCRPTLLSVKAPLSR